jgi:hypothetical protein
MGADLNDADLSDAELRGAYLTEANLSQADLSQADLSQADLSQADLKYANLSGADLSGADLSDASLKGARSVTDAQLAEARSLKGATMPDGTVFSDEFEPALSVRLSDGWDIAEAQTPDSISIHGPEAGQLNFTSPLHVFDASNPSEPKKLSAPENIDEWVSWFESHPNLDTSKPVPASVGDASGMRIDVTATSTSEDYPKDLCGGLPCVPLYTLSDENRILVYEGYKDRFVIVDVGSETVLIDVGILAGFQADRFDEFLPRAQKVLDHVEWNGG